MRYGLLSISILLVLAMLLSGCAAPTAVPPPAVSSIAAPTVVVATTAPTAVPPTAAPTAVVATTVPTAVSPTAAPTAAVATATPTPVRTSAAPTQAPTSSTQPTQVKPTAASGGSTKIDLNVLVPPGDGRDLVIENCMGCHSIAPILVSQKTAGEWQGTAVNHRSNLGLISDADYKKMFDYLAKYFGPDHKVPDLPADLLSGWTNY
jgi:hypothetical protein